MLSLTGVDTAGECSADADIGGLGCTNGGGKRGGYPEVTAVDGVDSWRVT